MTEPDSWEDLEQLTLQPTNTSPQFQNQQATTPQEDAAIIVEKKESTTEKDEIDQALKEALKNPRERANVLRIEADVSKFVSDKTRCTIEFSYDLTSYQRLLAHRVSQLYGLQTSSVPFGNGLSRVIAHKTQETKIPPVRVIDVKDLYKPPEAEKPTAPPDIVIKRRQGSTTGRGHLDGYAQKGEDGNSGGALTVKQREEEYKAARDRILGTEGGVKAGVSLEEKMIEEVEEDGKNRKAVFRDPAKEQQDPDYKRGSNRFQTPVVYDSMSYVETGKTQPPTGVYNVPTYNSEFPALPGAGFQPPPSADPQRPFLNHAQMNYGATVLNRPPGNQFPAPFPPPMGTGQPPGYPFPTNPLPYRLPNPNSMPGANTRPVISTGMTTVWNARPRPGTLPTTGATGPTSRPLLTSPIYSFAPPGPPHPFPSYPGHGYPPPMPLRPPYFPSPGVNPVSDGTVPSKETESSGNGGQIKTAVRRKPVSSSTGTHQN